MCSDVSEFADLYSKEDCFDLSCDCVRELYNKAWLNFAEYGMKIKTFILINMKIEIAESYIFAYGMFLVYHKDGTNEEWIADIVKEIAR